MSTLDPSLSDASDNPPSRKRTAPSERMTRRRRETQAHAGVADDYAAAAFPRADVVEVAPPDDAVPPAVDDEAADAFQADAFEIAPAGSVSQQVDGDAEPMLVGQNWEWREGVWEAEAEKVWTLAGVLRAANTAWGIDEGINADVREARALMAEARRQVREDAPIGEHYRADGARVDS